jgi:hypothetical protein
MPFRLLRVFRLLSELIVLSLVVCLGGCLRDEPYEGPTAVDIDEALHVSEQLAPDLSVKPQPVPVIDRDSQGKVLTYLIESRLVDQYWFKVTL